MNSSNRTYFMTSKKTRITRVPRLALYLLTVTMLFGKTLSAQEVESTTSPDYLGGLTPAEQLKLYPPGSTTFQSIEDGDVATLPTNYRNATISLYHSVADAKTLYCNCNTIVTKSDEIFDSNDCSYEPINPASWKGKLWAEHLLPAYWIAKYDPESTCWDSAQCRDREKNRDCCSRLDSKFASAHVDLVNLFPSIDEVNRARESHTFSEIPEENHLFGTCDFEYSNADELAEPRPEIRGDIARVYLYMAETYGLEYPPELLDRIEAWNEDDPVDQAERRRNARIYKIQGQAIDGL